MVRMQSKYLETAVSAPLFSHEKGLQMKMPSIFVAVMLLFCLPVLASDWPGFRGPEGACISDENHLPTEWSETKNLVWKLALPGRGSSSPIVSGDRVFVTCYSG